MDLLGADAEQPDADAALAAVEHQCGAGSGRVALVREGCLDGGPELLRGGGPALELLGRGPVGRETGADGREGCCGQGGGDERRAAEMCGGSHAATVEGRSKRSLTAASRLAKRDGRGVSDPRA